MEGDIKGHFNGKTTKFDEITGIESNKIFKTKGGIKYSSYETKLKGVDK